MSLELSQGAKANHSGRELEEHIAGMLRLEGFRRRMHVQSLAQFKAETGDFFMSRGVFATQVSVPITADPYGGWGLKAKVDFVVATPRNEIVLIIAKRQETDGSAEQKLDYEIQDLLGTELPSALYVHGDGFRESVLRKAWYRAIEQGRHQLLLFRTPEKLRAWIRDGLPSTTPGLSFSQAFNKYCDREP